MAKPTTKAEMTALIEALQACMEAIGYRGFNSADLLGDVSPFEKKTYQVDPVDEPVTTLKVKGLLPCGITWMGDFTKAGGLKITYVDAMSAPDALMTRLGACGLNPRVTFRSGFLSEDGDPSEWALEDLKPLVMSLEEILNRK
jgi:hypothetical protein